MSCGNGLRYDKITAYYLLDHPDLAWVSTNSSEMLKVPNAIILNGTSGLLWPFMFGRTFFNGQWTLGKAHVGNNAFLLNFWGNNIEQRYFDNFQVLTCTPQTNGQTTTPREPTRSTQAASTAASTNASTQAPTNAPTNATTQTPTNAPTTVATSAPNYQCGDLIPFAGNDVSQLGLSSGTYIDGSTVYPGKL
jgi:hypothetical protein